jgi:hypothetical protein
MASLMLLAAAPVAESAALAALVHVSRAAVTKISLFMA